MKLDFIIITKSTNFVISEMCIKVYNGYYYPECGHTDLSDVYTIDYCDYARNNGYQMCAYPSETWERVTLTGRCFNCIYMSNRS